MQGFVLLGLMFITAMGLAIGGKMAVRIAQFLWAAVTAGFRTLRRI